MVKLGTPAQILVQMDVSITNMIVDEAGLMDLIHYGTFYNKIEKRLIAVGDPEQREPYIREFVKDSPLVKTVFDAYKVNAILKYVYRLPRIFTNFISRNFYNNQLYVKNEKNGKFVLKVHKFLSENYQNSVRNIHTTSLYEKCDIILVPYNAQKEFLIGHGYHNVETVDSFQGSEANVVLYDMTVSHYSNFVLDPHRVNVAFSRVKEKMIVVVHDALWEHFTKIFGCP